MKSNKQLKYSNYVAFGHFHGIAVNNSGLRFLLVNTKDLDMTPKRDTVNVSLDIDSGTWDMKPDERVRYFKELLKDRDVEILPGTSYASCVLTTHKETIEEKRVKVLNKLTSEERKLLGLE